MTTMVWNPSHFKIGKPGRSNCPKWQGIPYTFQENEVKRVHDDCAKWLTKQFKYFGLVALPDRNDPDYRSEEAFDKEVTKRGEEGIQELYKHSVRIIDQYRTECKKLIDARESVRRPDEFVKFASEVQEKYYNQIMDSDPETIREHELMRKILGTVEYDSDKELDKVLGKELQDADKNKRQYTHEPYNVQIKDTTPNKPGEPIPESEPSKNPQVKQKKNRGGKRATTPKPQGAANTMGSMKTTPNLDNSAI